MSRILLLGMSPLPTENETHTLGPGKRTWQFVRGLLEKGHRVCLVCSRHLAAYQDLKLNPIVAEEHGNLIYYSLDQTVFENISWLQKLHDHFDPDCIVGATVYPSYIATKLKTQKPLWADLFGHLMAEAQTKSLVFNDDYYLSQLWKFERDILDHADIFSVVSSPQAYATIGELGSRGRLNSATTGYPFIRIIPCAINDIEIFSSSDHQNVLRGKYVEPDDFVVLWSGGYNTWTDVKTLFKALENAFQVNPKIKFVSTGGKIQSHDELTYNSFIEMIEKSKFNDRFVMRGWIPFNEVPYYWQEADVGINIDLFSYEAILGSRNRILDWMQSGLPVLTSELCELANIIKDNKLCFTFLPEDSKSLTDLLLFLADKPGILEETAKRAKQFVESEFTIVRTTEPLQAWVQSPETAPDKGRVPRISASESQKVPQMLSHYSASIRNQIKHNGIIGTLRWFMHRNANVFGKNPK